MALFVHKFKLNETKTSFILINLWQIVICYAACVLLTAHIIPHQHLGANFAELLLCCEMVSVNQNHAALSPPAGRNCEWRAGKNKRVQNLHFNNLFFLNIGPQWNWGLLNEKKQQHLSRTLLFLLTRSRQKTGKRKQKAQVYGSK